MRQGPGLAQGLCVDWRP